jgi:DNA-binding transcriptional regulator YdaS (Cro superfamily)
MRKDESNKSFVNDTRLWLKIIGKNRTWLAKELGVSPSAVSSWLHSGRHVPERHKSFVKMLMKERADKKQSTEYELKQRRCSQVFVEMDEETLNIVARAAGRSGFPFSEWISYAAREYSEHVLEAIRRKEYSE